MDNSKDINKLVELQRENFEFLGELLSTYFESIYKGRLVQNNGGLLLAKEQYMQKFFSEFAGSVDADNYFETIARGFKKIHEELSRIIPEEEYQTVKIELENHLKSYDIRQIIKKEDEKEIEKLFVLSEKSRNNLYRVAKALYESKEYAHAADVFTVLTFLDPFVFEFWLGLGLSLQYDLQYEKAVRAFSQAESLDAVNPAPRIYSSICFVQLGDKRQAESKFRSAQKLIVEQGAEENWKVYLSALNNDLRRIA